MREAIALETMKCIRIFVQNSEGRIIPYNVDPDVTIEEIKTKIAESEGVPVVD